MARLPAVLNALEKIGGHDRKTWDVFARKLREAGELAPTKRGAGATSLDAEQIAKILLAGMATDSPAKGPDMVRLFWPMKRQHEIANPQEGMKALGADTLGEALTGILLNVDHLVMSIALAFPGFKAVYAKMFEKQDARSREDRELYQDVIEDADIRFVVDRSGKIARMFFGTPSADDDGEIDTTVLAWAHDLEPGSAGAMSMTSTIYLADAFHLLKALVDEDPSLATFAER